MTALTLGILGGSLSFLSTSVGVLGTLIAPRVAAKTRWHLSMDFALGLMVSAAAVSLIGPAALDATRSGHSLAYVAAAVAAGLGFVLAFHRIANRIESRSSPHKGETSGLLLAGVLMLHNLPEGLASGAALAGLDHRQAWPILSGIAIQNIPEGALMVLCLSAMGWSRKSALLGGFGSGLVELVGGTMAGLLLDAITGILPSLLAFTGGAMMAAVMTELSHGKVSVLHRILSRDFAIGLLALPLLQLASG